MYNQYVEVLVKRKTIEGLDKIKFVVVFFIVAFFVVGIIFQKLLFCGVASILGIIYCFVSSCLEVEYEYYYLNGELDIDKIIKKSRRKKMLSLNAAMIQKIMPVDAWEMRRFESAQKIDCSANDPTRAPYVIICSHQNKLKKVYIQMNDELLTAIRSHMPNKVL